MNSPFADLPATVFEEISALARTHDAVNPGQRFPDDPGPEDVRAHAACVLMGGSNQYPPMMGLPKLRSAVAERYARLQGLDLAPRMRATSPWGLHICEPATFEMLAAVHDPNYVRQALAADVPPAVGRTIGMPVTSGVS